MLRQNNQTPNPRPDLAAYPVPMPLGFIGGKILPSLPRFGMTGVTYYQAYVAFQAVHAARASGGNVTGVAVANSHYTFSCTEALYRARADEQEIVQLGGDAAAEKILALKAKRAVYKEIEGRIQNALAAIGWTDISSTDTTIFNGILSAVSTLEPKVMGHTGTLAMWGAKTAINKLRNNSFVVDRMKNIGVQLSDGTDARRVGLTALAQIFQVSEVMEAIDGIWPTSGIFVGYIPDPNEDPTVSAQLGRTTKFQFDAQGQEVSCVEGYDNITRSPYIDMVSYVEPKILNADFCIPLELGVNITT